MTKNGPGLGLIPISLPLLFLFPSPVLACDYSDVVCSLRNVFHNTVNRYVGEDDNSQNRDQQLIESATRPHTIEKDMGRYRRSVDQRLRTLAHLQYPQNERSIIERIGTPDYRGQDGDYYRTSEGDVLVWYVETRATGFMVVR